MNLRHLEWLIEEPLPNPQVTLYEILPYSREQADRIIQHLCALGGFDLGQSSDDPACAERVRQVFRLIVDAAGARQAQLDLDKLQRDLGEPSWRDRLRDLRNDRRQFATAIGDRSTCAALRWALSTSTKSPPSAAAGSITCVIIRMCCGKRSTEL